MTIELELPMPLAEIAFGMYVHGAPDHGVDLSMFTEGAFLDEITARLQRMERGDQLAMRTRLARALPHNPSHG